ncbi:ATPase AAA [Longimycelium tulufanense]|uniref:ATPase AAA n=1 Tax=Longimycelium tulufanense TaxID=907463 RepID=A0A8J3CE08_9PSEU|nr:ATPase AAA [Longimycelium tulufanense]
MLLDGYAATDCAAGALPRRHGVLVFCSGEPPPPVWQAAVAVGAERVLALPAAESWLISRFADAIESPGPVVGRILAVCAGRGGAGASVLAAAVAAAAAHRGSRTLLVDCDPHGGGLDLLLGIEERQGPRWPVLALTGGRVAAASLHATLPTVQLGDAALTVLSCDRSGKGPSPAAVAAVLEAGRRAGDTVVCDLPRYPTDAALTVLGRADLTVLLVPAEVRACAAASGVARAALEHGARLGLLVRGPAPGGLTPADVATALDLPLLAATRPEPGLERALDRGRLPLRRRGPLAGAARAVLTAADRAEPMGGAA